MRQTRDAMDYFLVFAGQHPLGLEKMKEAMKRFDQTGEYRFSDADSGQDSLFRYDIPEKYAMRVAEVFAGRTVTFGILRDYALNDTPFNNPKQMLKCLESKDLIVVETYGSRHKGTFNEEKIKSITFK
jgi:hypothetical protein